MKRRKKKNEIDYTFVAFPRHILRSREYYNLSAKAVKLLLDIFSQFNGKNNGDFCTVWPVMKKKGWKSRDTLTKALRELDDRGFIEKTRQGGKNLCSLYAVSWLPIHECENKLNVRATHTSSNLWRTNT